METTPTLTPSSELISSTPSSVAGAGVGGAEQLSSLDLSSLFSSVPGGAAPTAGIEVGIPVAGGTSNGSFTMDLSLVSSGILTIDPSSVGTTLVASAGTTLAKPLEPLVMVTGADLAHQHGLEGTVGDVLPPQGTLNLDDVQSVTPEALGTLAALSMQGATVDPALQHPLGSTGGLGVESAAGLAVAPVSELLASPSKVAEVGAQGGVGHLLGCVEVLGPQEGGKVVTSQFIFPGSGGSGFSPQKELDLAVSPSSFLVRENPSSWFTSSPVPLMSQRFWLGTVRNCSVMVLPQDSGGSARTDYRAIQLAKKKKQRGSSAGAGEGLHLPSTDCRVTAP